MKNNPVKQHTVPKTYLKHFSHNSKNIFVYDKNKNTVEERNVKNVSIIKDFYTFVDEESGEKLYDLEIFLGTDIEPNYNPTINLIQKKKGIDSTHRTNLSAFIAAQLLRSPKIKRTIIKEIEEVYLSGQSKKFTDPDDLKTLTQSFYIGDKVISENEFIQEKNKEGVKLTVDVGDVCYLQQIPNNLVKLSKKLLYKKWVFLSTPNKRFFITSDNPIFNTTDYPNVSFGRLTGDIFVLTKQLALMMIEVNECYDYTYMDLDLKEVRAINRSIQLNSDRWIFSHSKELLSKNIKHENDEITV